MGLRPPNTNKDWNDNLLFISEGHTLDWIANFEPDIRFGRNMQTGRLVHDYILLDGHKQKIS